MVGGRGVDTAIEAVGACRQAFITCEEIVRPAASSKLDKILDAYETFGAAGKTNALKVLIEA